VTEEIDRRKELCQTIKDSQRELDELNHADHVARAPKVAYVRWGFILDGESYCGKDRMYDTDIRYVRYDLAARLYEMFELTAGVACSCASTGPDDVIEKQVDELLEEAGWLRKPDETGGCCDGNECEAVSKGYQTQDPKAIQEGRG